MPIMINHGKEMLRISPKDNKKIEYSTNQGRTWMVCYNGLSNIGVFCNLMGPDKEIPGITDKNEVSIFHSAINRNSRNRDHLTLRGTP